MNIILTLLMAISIVESKNNDNAVGKHGEIGRYQIRQCYLDDANRFLKSNYTLQDMKNPDIAKQVVIAYLTHYGNHYQKKTGKTPTFEIYARIHNGGPYGYKKDCTIPYWKKLEKELKKWTR